MWMGGRQAGCPGGRARGRGGFAPRRSASCGLRRAASFPEAVACTHLLAPCHRARRRSDALPPPSLPHCLASRDGDRGGGVVDRRLAASGGERRRALSLPPCPVAPLRGRPIQVVRWWAAIGSPSPFTNPKCSNGCGPSSGTEACRHVEAARDALPPGRRVRRPCPGCAVRLAEQDTPPFGSPARRPERVRVLPIGPLDPQRAGLPPRRPSRRAARHPRPRARCR